MGEVVTGSTSLMSDRDLHAIAVYLKNLPASPSRTPGVADTGAMVRGEAIYSDACAFLSHGGRLAASPRLFPCPIRGDSMLQQSDPIGLTHLIMAGSRTGPTAARPTATSMPSFAWKLTDQQIADVSTYIRNSWGNLCAGRERRDGRRHPPASRAEDIASDRQFGRPPLTTVFARGEERAHGQRTGEFGYASEMRTARRCGAGRPGWLRHAQPRPNPTDDTAPASRRRAIGIRTSRRPTERDTRRARRGPTERRRSRRKHSQGRRGAGPRRR